MMKMQSPLIVPPLRQPNVNTIQARIFPNVNKCWSLLIVGRRRCSMAWRRRPRCSVATGRRCSMACRRPTMTRACPRWPPTRPAPQATCAVSSITALEVDEGRGWIAKRAGHGGKRRA
ncbi:hypothetical protein PVAP13_5KG301507 [Panicum virgatum]|uniref:Uncharacterized protein n=1 Tax=Panicum virgatum TaxID=38727 RepID=A0A8T0SGM9_PANVG|nr:hypothetical protein PVAP13_5KG301507 [Panicum virgatum]